MLRLAATLALLLPAPAGAAGPAAVLDGCATGPERADRRAVFVASMPARPGADVLALRFTLQRATPRGWRAIAAPGFDRWRRSRPGAGGLRFEQAVAGLHTPGRFRVLVRFRWLDGGRVVGRASRRSRACAQPDWRPDLRVESITAAASADGAADYVVSVRNVGRGPAEERFDVVLGLAGANRPPATVLGLDAGDVAAVRITGPACRPGEVVRATADAGRVVVQRRRSDDVLDVACPLHSVGS